MWDKLDSKLYNAVVSSRSTTPWSHGINLQESRKTYKNWAIKRFNVHIKWGTWHTESIANLKNLAHSVTLSMSKYEHDVRLFTDASDTNWAAELTKVPSKDRKLAIEKQNHERLCFPSVNFLGSKEHWSVPKNGGFALTKGMTGMDHVTSGNTVRIHADHT